MQINFLLLMVLGVLISCFAQVLLKMSADKNFEAEGILKQYLNPLVVVGYSLYLLVLIIPLIAYRYIDFKYGAIIESTAYIFIMLLSYIFFKEKITKQKIIGNVIIIAGIIVFNSNFINL